VAQLTPFTHLLLPPVATCHNLSSRDIEDSKSFLAPSKQPQKSENKIKKEKDPKDPITHVLSVKPKRQDTST
jgi:hypothetical protein